MLSVLLFGCWTFTVLGSSSWLSAQRTMWYHGLNPGPWRAAYATQPTDLLLQVTVHVCIIKLLLKMPQLVMVLDVHCAEAAWEDASLGRYGKAPKLKEGLPVLTLPVVVCGAAAAATAILTSLCHHRNQRWGLQVFLLAGYFILAFSEFRFF